jgi:hypothetical protein
MQGSMRIAAGAGLALALGIPAGAWAETLIYVTATQIGTVDSSNPSSDNTAGNRGPLSYSLPSGYSTVGAKVSDDAQTLFLLAYNGSTCQLFAVNTSGGSSGSAGLTAEDGSFSCTISSGAGDFDFINGTGGSAIDAYLVADGTELDEIAAGGASASGLTVETPSGGSTNLVGLASVGSSPNAAQYGIDAATDYLVQLGLGTSPASETNVVALGFTPSGSTSLDYSPDSGSYYLYSGGQVYASSTPASGFSAIGSAPGGTLSVAAAESVGVSNNGGAFGPAGLLSLLGLAALRRRRRVS